MSLLPSNRHVRLLLEAALLTIIFIFSGCGPSTEEQILSAYDPYADGTRTRNTKSFAEIELGQYFVTFRNPDTGITRVFRSNIIAVVPNQAQYEFNKLKADHEKRLRAKIRQILQKVDIKRFGPPTVRLLKSDIVKTVRRTLQTDSIKEVVFSELSIE